MRKVEINKDLSRLSPSQFEKWFKSRESLKGQDWETHYKKIGGKIPKKKLQKEE